MHPLVVEQSESIDDASALALRDDVVAAMIADACRVMLPIRELAMCGVSPFAVARCLWADQPMHETRLQTILLRTGFQLGVLRIDNAPTINPPSRPI